jgi:transposase
MISEKIRAGQRIEEFRRARGILCPGTSQGDHSMPLVPVNPPDPEVPEKAARRRFTVEYKLQILRQADVCCDVGGVGALLRREGLYSSHITTWRRQRDAGILSGLKPKQRGRKANPIHPLQVENEQLHKENNRMQKRLKQAELIIEVQKKISQMLGIPLETFEKGEDD